MPQGGDGTAESPSHAAIPTTIWPSPSKMGIILDSSVLT